MGLKQFQPVVPATSEMGLGYVATGQVQTHAPQQAVQLFDQLVSAAEQRNGESEAQRVSGLKVDHELHFLVLLDRQIGGLG